MSKIVLLDFDAKDEERLRTEDFDVEILDCELRFDLDDGLGFFHQAI